jgi:hypothetical protein
MQIPIAVSNVMETRRESEILESKLIRVPAGLREHLGIELHTFLNLQTKTGENISLIVEKAYKEDGEKDPLKAYLTSSTHALLSDTAENNVELCQEITLGCDPEMLIVNRFNNSIVDAHRIFRHWNPVGSDGLLLEFRPVPSTMEEVVVGNLFVQMVEARKTLNIGKTIYNAAFNGQDYVLMARSYYNPFGATMGGQNVGFHIHLGLPRNIMSGNHNHLLVNIAMMMDYYVGIPAILIEGEHDNVRRSQTRISYGKPGDWRRGAGNVTFEYRVPGGALMKTPETALGILSIAGVVMEDIISRVQAATDSFKNMEAVRTNKDLRDLYPTVPAPMDVFGTVCSPSIKPAWERMRNIYTDYEKMVGFARRKDTIDRFLKIAAEPKNISEFVEQNWRTFYEQRQSKPLDILQQSGTAGAIG